MIKLKATDGEKKSDSIILSFDSKWDTPLSRGLVNVIFRKRGPASSKVNWIYAYLGSPIKAITGRFHVVSINKEGVEDALKMANSGAISTSELSSYAEKYDNLYVFQVNAFQRFNRAIPYDQLRDIYSFSPPQSFLFLSDVGRMEIERLAGLAEIKDE